jgi:hypothetical protein
MEAVAGVTEIETSVAPVVVVDAFDTLWQPIPTATSASSEKDTTIMLMIKK